MRIDVLNAAAPLTTTTNAASTAQTNTATADADAVQSTAMAAPPPSVAAQAAAARNETAEAERYEMPDSVLLSTEEIDDLVKTGNSLFEQLRMNEQFQLRRHEKLPRTMIRLVDVQKDLVIREFPPKNYLDLVAALQELSGLMVDERV